MDTDLDSLTREQLIAEVKKLRNAIREHRDSSGHGLCWHHPQLWCLLPEKTDPQPVVRLAEVHGRLHPLPAVARRTIAQRAAHRRRL